MCTLVPINVHDRAIHSHDTLRIAQTRTVPTTGTAKGLAMYPLSQAPAFISHRLALALLLSTSLLAACGGGGSSNAPTVASDSPATPETPREPETPDPTPEPEPEPEPLNRYQFANGCYTLQSQQQFLATSEDGYRLTNDAGQATAFYMKPTDLGRYLLLSDYQRDPGSAGSKQLLGISDPAGEFLDQSGNFVGELSYLVSGLGDTLNLVLDPVAPLGGLLRELGESLGGIGTGLGDTNIQPSLAMVVVIRWAASTASGASNAFRPTSTSPRHFTKLKRTKPPRSSGPNAPTPWDASATLKAFSKATPTTRGQAIRVPDFHRATAS